MRVHMHVVSGVWPGRVVQVQCGGLVCDAQPPFTRQETRHGGEDQTWRELRSGALQCGAARDAPDTRRQTPHPSPSRRAIEWGQDRTRQNGKIDTPASLATRCLLNDACMVFDVWWSWCARVLVSGLGLGALMMVMMNARCGHAQVSCSAAHFQVDLALTLSLAPGW